MRKPVKNLGASVRARLLNLAKSTDQPFELLLTRYTLERFLCRLSLSSYRDRFVLKGAMLLASAIDDPFRPTRDLDLLGFGDPNPTDMISVFREICGIQLDDAVVFNVAGLAIAPIRDEAEYGGLRVKASADVSGANVPVFIDIGFGDAIEPGLVEIDLPVLLDQPTPHLRAYPFEAVIAEKFQAMVVLGRANSRMKDFYDIWVLARSHKIDERGLIRAIAATFARRKTEVPIDPPDALTPAFANDPVKQKQWAAFVKSLAFNPGPLNGVIEELVAFLMPLASKAADLLR